MSWRLAVSIALPERLVAPTFLTHPPFEHSIGDLVADFSASLGFVPDPEQRLALQVMYSQTGPGATYSTMSPRWSAMEFAVVAPRQNLKSGLFKMAMLADLFLLECTRVTWSAHLFKTSRAAFVDIQQIIEANPGLSKYVKRVTEGAGNEGVDLMSGARLQFMTRSKTGGRGLTGEKVILDEALMLTDEQMAALMPTMSAIPNPMLCYGSSPGLPGESLELRRIRNRGREGDSTLGYLEWTSLAKCADGDKCRHEVGTEGCIADDEDEWAKVNPALDRRISREYVRGERRSLRPDTFMRERMGVWPAEADSEAIPEKRWVACAGDGEIVGPVSVFVDVTLDRSESVVWVCGANGDGLAQIECADARRGTDWTSERVAELIERHEVVAVGARSAGPVASMLPDLRGVCDDAQVDFVKVGSGEFAGMCGAFYDAVMTGTLRHRNDSRLNRAVSAAKRHRQVDTWTWERTLVDVDAAPLVAATGAFALFAQNSTPYDPLSNLW
jgi:hypothetical protein